MICSNKMKPNQNINHYHTPRILPRYHRPAKAAATNDPIITTNDTLNLSFHMKHYWNTHNYRGQLIVEVSNNGGGSWENIGSFSGSYPTIPPMFWF